MRRVLAIMATVAVALTGCVPGASQPFASPGNTPATSSPPPATTSPTAPSPSPIAAHPSGSIAFVRPVHPSGDGPIDVYLVDASTGKLTRLTRDEQLEGNLYWVQDGSRLVYAWSTAMDPYHARLTSVLPDGSDPQDLGPAQIPYSSPAMSPERERVVFSGDGTDDGTSGLVLLDLTAGTRTQLTTDGATGAIWSPDGTRLLAYLPSRRVVIVDATTGAELARIRDVGVESVLGWTDDGRSVIYHSCGPDLGKFQCIDEPPLIAAADGTNVRPYSGVLPDPSDMALPSPDGKWILSSTPEGRLSVMAATGGTPVSLGVGSGPAWSPDSAWIVFAGAATEPVASAEGLSAGLFAVGREGGQAIQLTYGPYDQEPAWQPR